MNRARYVPRGPGAGLMFSVGWLCFLLVLLTLFYMTVKEFAERPEHLLTLAGIGVGLVSMSYVITVATRR